MGAPGERADGVDDNADGVPDEARDSLGQAAEDLEVDARYVGWWDDVRDEAKRNDDSAKFAEAVQGGETLD